MSSIRHLPLRVRLALMLGAVLIATIALVLLAVGAAVDRVLVSQAAERLEIGAGLLVDRPRTGPPVTELDASEVARLLGGQGTAVAILGADGSVLGTADNGAPGAVAGARLDPASYAAAIASGATARVVIQSAAGRVLVVAAPIRLTTTGRVDGSDGGGQGGPPFVPPGQAKKGATPAPDQTAAATVEDGPPNSIAQLAVSLAPVDETIAELRRQLVWLGALALAVGLAATVLLTTRATRPLDRVVTAAARLADGDLGARTGVSGTDEVGAVGLAFDTMADRLQAAFQAQRAFAADASHELRTPLAVLGGYVDVLRRSSLPADEERRLLGSMRREIDRLTRLASDLLLLAQLEAGAPALQPRDMDLADLVREQADSARMLDPNVGVESVADEPLPVFADPDRIAQVLRNLIENAIRHAAAGTPVVVRAFRDAEAAAVQVVNAGAPIGGEELPHVFDRFVRGRVEGRQGTNGGAANGGVASGGAANGGVASGGAANGPAAIGHAGLGLAIARAIVEASGGSIAVESGPSTTRFTIRLDLSTALGSQQLLSERSTRST
jgi:signal transduction histidine kinase